MNGPRPGKPLLDAVRDGLVVVDGALGTELHARGIPYRDCFEELSLSRPALIQAVHDDYVRAGARAVETNTFGANALRLHAHGLADRARDINLAGVRIARAAAGGRAYVLGAVGPSGRNLGDASADELAAVGAALGEQARALLAAGVDALILETVRQPRELEVGVRSLVEAAAAAGVPVIAAVSLDERGLMSDGTTAFRIARLAKDWGAAIVGVNCAEGPAGVVIAMEQMKPVGLPLFAAPSAGLPREIDGRLVYASTPADFADFGRRMRGLGVRMVGGCCGTTPAHTTCLASAA